MGRSAQRVCSGKRRAGLAYYLMVATGWSLVSTMSPAGRASVVGRWQEDAVCFDDLILPLDGRVPSKLLPAHALQPSADKMACSFSESLQKAKCL